MFLSFTLSQAGMVRHWARRSLTRPGGRAACDPPPQAINALGAGATGAVFVIVLVTKFASGAWIVVLAAPLLFLAMKAIARHYARVTEALAPAAAGVAVPARVHGVVLVCEPPGPNAAGARLRAGRLARDPARRQGAPRPAPMTRSPTRGWSAGFRCRW